MIFDHLVMNWDNHNCCLLWSDHIELDNPTENERKLLADIRVLKAELEGMENKHMC